MMACVFRPETGSFLAAALLLSLAVSASSCAGKGAVPEDGEGLPVVLLREAAPLEFPGADNPKRDRFGETDCNSPAHWDGGTLYIFNSAGHPWRSAGIDIFHLGQSYLSVKFNNEVNGGRWFECTWKDEDGTLYGWYHHEPGDVCPETRPAKHVTAPKIGAARSKDNGETWEDLGIILESPPGSNRCDTPNKYFAGGNGDFSAMLDGEKKHLYFFISTYTALEEQGVSVARMEYAHRDQPVGKVWKWHEGSWTEPGLGGHITPIFPAKVDWHRKDTDAFWGPSIHRNTHLETYVILLNRARDSDWTQEGVYVTFNRDLSDPGGWSSPRKILDREEVFPKMKDKSLWYPQVIGLDAARRETDKLAGRRARLFLHGESLWEAFFLKPGETADRD
jgi:hypothetical protein